MKFSYSLQFNTVPEWTEDYLSYGVLKKTIHEVETAKLEEAKNASGSSTADAVQDSSAVELGERSVQLDAEFRRLFRLDAERVANVFAAKKAACDSNLAELFAAVTSDSDSSSASSEVSVNRIEVWTGDEDSLEKRRASLESRFNTVYLNLHDLHDFLDLNYTGYVKLVKSYAKYLSAPWEIKKELLAIVDSIIPVAELSELQGKMAQIEEVYARVMCDGSVPQARAALHLLLRDRVAASRQVGSTELTTADSSIMKTASVLPVSTKAAASPVAKKEKYFTNYRIFSLIFCTIMFAAIFLLPLRWFSDAELLKKGKVDLTASPKRSCLAILLTCTTLWITEGIPLYVTALLIPALAIIFRVITPDTLIGTDKYTAHVEKTSDLAKFVFGSMFSDMVFTLIGGFSIAAAFQKYGITKSAAVVLLKNFGRTPSSVLLSLMMITVVASAFVSNVAAPVLCFGLIQPILQALDHDSDLAKSIILGIAFAANIGGLASPIASPQSVIGMKELSKVSFFSWLYFSTPIAIVSVIACWFWLRFVYPSKETLNFTEIFATKRGEKTASLGQFIYILCVFAMTLTMWVATEQLEGVTGAMGVTAVFPVVALFGAGLLGKDDFNGFSWNVVFLALGGSALGKALQYSGLLAMIGNAIKALLDGFPAFAVMAIFCAILLFITTFVSHSVGAMVFLPIIKAFYPADQIVNQNALVLMACFTCSAGMAMPISGFPNMTAAALQDRNKRYYVGTGEFTKGGVVPSIVFAVSITLFVYLLAPFVIKP